MLMERTKPTCYETIRFECIRFFDTVNDFDTFFVYSTENKSNFFTSVTTS